MPNGSGRRSMIAALLLAAPAAAGDGAVVPLPHSDRSVLEKYLGSGVVGEAVAAPAIEDPAAWFTLDAGTWKGRVTSGNGKGDRVEFVLRKNDGDEYGTNWTFKVGDDVNYLRQTKAGELEAPAVIDLDQGVVSRFSPAEPRMIRGMKPGASKVFKTDVKVYDLRHPSKLEHTGSLEITFAYVGAYTVTVPAGTYDAALFRWHYKGKVGPASVEETIYRFHARGVGPVAWVELENISAFLIYNDHTKIGAVLTAQE